MSKRDHAGLFKKGDRRTNEAARRGGLVRAAQTRRAVGPYRGTIIEFLDTLDLTGPTWKPWRVFWKAVFAVPMGDEEIAIYTRHTERESPPEKPVEEAWMPIGRRGGKSRNAAVGAAFLGIRFDPSRLAPGETAVIPVIAADRKQARQVLNYLKGIFAVPEFKPFMHRELKEAIELNNQVTIEVATASFRTIRGYTVVGAVLDEIAFWRTDDGSANPDHEVLSALRPGMATIADGLLLGLSNPYAARGELFRAVERSFGRDDPRVLVWNSDSRSMNPSLPAHVVERAFDGDPVAAASEYGMDGRVSFRRDVEAFLDADAIRAVTVSDRRELPSVPRRHRYVAFVDPSGGSQDSFTLAVAHLEGQTAVLDCVRERRPPFSPDDVVKEFAELLRSYGLGTVTGDRYAGEWPRERFRVHGIRYEPSERTKSDIYREIVAPVNGGTVELLDLPVLRAQLMGLERRVARGGKDSVDHAPGSRDDVANAAAGALVLAAATLGGAGWGNVALVWG